MSNDPDRYEVPMLICTACGRHHSLADDYCPRCQELDHGWRTVCEHLLSIAMSLQQVVDGLGARHQEE